MSSYGQFCAVARSHEILGGRWTILIVREIFCGAHRFNDLRRGLPRISRTMLSERLQELVLAGVVLRVEGGVGPEYVLTEAGRELSAVIGSLATWGQRWLPRIARDEDLDADPVLIDLERRVRFERLPPDPLVVRFELNKLKPRFLLLKKAEASLCARNRGFPEPLRVRGPLPALVGWWRGDVSFIAAQRQGLVVEGPRELRRAFPDWFDRYAFANVQPAPGARQAQRA